MTKTPTTPEGLEQFDHLEPAEAVRMAWTDPGNYPAYHRAIQVEVQNKMPVLARALDRLTGHTKS